MRKAHPPQQCRPGVKPSRSTAADLSASFPELAHLDRRISDIANTTAALEVMAQRAGFDFLAQLLGVVAKKARAATGREVKAGTALSFYH